MLAPLLITSVWARFPFIYDKKSYKHEVELLILSVGLPVYAALH